MKEKLLVKDFNQFGGKHCWTTALKNVFDYHGLHRSEEMLFGLGGGLGFIYWYVKMMPAPFIGARYGKGVEPLVNTCQRIGGDATVIETTSMQKGHDALLNMLREGKPAVVFVDMAYLPYLALPEGAHFGGHTVVVYGIDEEKNNVHVSERAATGLCITIEDLKKARNSKFPPFPAKNKLLQITYPQARANPEKTIRDSIRESCDSMLNPPIKNIGLPGMQKWAGLVLTWPQQFRGLNLFDCLFNTFIYIEIGGTGGSAFRPMYAQFLREASSIVNKPKLGEVAEMFEKSGKKWSEIAMTALPDSWPTLKRIRELSIEKNKIFEEQPPGALEKIQKISSEITDVLIGKNAAEEFEVLDQKRLVPILSDLRQKILELHEIEKKAFENLSKIIK
jgi:hypothetical protein